MNINYFFLFAFLCINTLFCQKDNNSLATKNETELLNLFFSSENRNYSVLIGKQYIALGKKKKDTGMISDGYSMVASKYTNELVIKYADSIISLNQEKPNKIYPTNGFLLKGYHYYDKKHLKLATKSFLEANKYASQYHNKAILFDSNYMIALLKDRIGNYNEALDIHKGNLKFARDNFNGDNQTRSLVPVYHGIAFSFRNLKKFDSALFYNNKALSRMSVEKDFSQRSYLLLNDGIINYHLRNHDISIKSINEALVYFLAVDDLPNIAESYFYLAKIYKSDDQIDNTITFLKKMDTIFLKTKDLLPELREGYELLIEHYKKKNNSALQLTYLERLIQLDSTISSNYKYVSNNIKKEYDIPNLVNRKEKLIKDLQKDKSNLRLYISASLILTLLILVFYNIKRKKDKKMFNLILEKASSQSIKVKSTERKIKDGNNISDDISFNIIENLQRFEEAKGFLDRKLTLNKLSKEFSTNSTYLSKTINHKYDKNFANYLSELRINYAVKRLKEDSLFRKYTIKAIAYESGFNNPETFSKTFKKNTGIYPSFYIKQLKKI